MTMTTLIGCIDDGIIYALMTLGLYLSYRVLNVADLTVDGSFTLGAAVSVMCALAGRPFLGLLLGGLAGSCAGLVTALFQTKLKIQPILAGILTMTGLYTINIWVMGGKPNIALMNSKTLFTTFGEIIDGRLSDVFAGISVVVIVIVGLVIFLYTPLGLAVRATGDNEAMVKASSINVDFTKIVGLMIANGLVGMSGAMMGQSQRFADANMGVGMVIMGLASLIIGEIVCVNIGEWLLGRSSIVLHMCGVVVGSIAYRLIIALALEFNFSTASMKLVSAMIIAIAISYPVIKEKCLLAVKKRSHHVNKKEERTCSN